ncbi:MAG TPA: hypothetical protein VIM51_00385 [Desulfosporosinus sp.]
MVKQSKTQGTSRKPWILVGALLMIVLIGAGGCSQSKTATAASTSQVQANQGQPGQGQRVRNPALQAAMEIRRLQSDPKNVLTSDQKDKIKPILQDLIKTADPSQEILQQKADAINAVLTAEQKSSLTTPRTPNGNRPQGGGGTGGSNGGGAGAGTGAGTAGKQGNASTPQVMYQQILDSLK